MIFEDWYTRYSRGTYFLRRRVLIWSVLRVFRRCHQSLVRCFKNWHIVLNYELGERVIDFGGLGEIPTATVNLHTSHDAKPKF